MGRKISQLITLGDGRSPSLNDLNNIAAHQLINELISGLGERCDSLRYHSPTPIEMLTFNIRKIHFRHEKKFQMRSNILSVLETSVRFY